MALTPSESVPGSDLGTTEVAFPGEIYSASARRGWMRQLNSVRKQEFAYLRSIQKREGGETSEPTLAGVPVRLQKTAEARGETVKKIDEIEARIELLWSLSREKPVDSRLNSTATQTPSIEQVTESKIPDPALLVAPVKLASRTPLTAQSSPQSTAASPPATVSDASKHGDQALATAATLFAKADYAGATECLQKALRGAQMGSPDRLRLARALLEVYRATHAQDLFDAAVLQYFDYWNGCTPQWRTPAAAHGSRPMAPTVPPNTTNHSAKPARRGPTAWRCPAVLDAVAAHGFIDHWRSQQHCEIAWQALVSIQAQAAELLAEELSAPADAPLHLMFWGADRLLSVLAQATPQGQSQVPRGLWALRFCLLARMHLSAAYDKAATDFCLTYIAPAPPWWLSSPPLESDLQAPISTDRSVDSPEWQLQGHIVGAQGLDLPDLSGTLISQPISINCAALLRMDPAAIAQWVRWLRNAKAKKAEIHLQNVGVLVEAAWVSAGVDRFAEIHPQELA